MNRSINRLIYQTGLYAISNLAIKISGLALAPLYLNTSLLPQESFGYLILLESLIQLCILITGCGIAHALLKHMTEENALERYEALPFTALITLGIISLLVILIFTTYSSKLSHLILQDSTKSNLIIYTTIYIAIKVIGGIPLMIFRVQEKAKHYLTVIIFELIILIICVYYFLSVRLLGLEGILFSFIISAGVTSTILLFNLLLQIRWKIDVYMVPKLIIFGLPLVLAGLGSQILNVGDRFILQWLTESETVAIYGWAARFGGIINLIFVQSFNFAFLTIGLKSLTAKEKEINLYPRAFRHFTIWTGFGVLVLSLSTFDITRIITSEQNYLLSDPLVFPIALGFLCYGLLIIVMNILFAQGRTGTIAILMGIAAVSNIVLNLILIPYIGALGAAISTFLAYLFLVILTNKISGKYLPVKYPWKVFAIVLVITTGLYFLALYSVEWDTYLRILFRMGLIGMYGALIFFLGLYKISEVREGIELLRKRLRLFKNG